MSKRIFIINVCSLLICTLLFSGCSTSSKPITKTGFYFDTVITITIYDSTDTALLNQSFSICSQYEQLFSKTIASSDVNKIGRKQHLSNLSLETLEIMKKALYYSKLTNGAFDVTIAPASNLWDFKANPPVAPNPADIENTLSRIGYENVSIVDQTLILAKENMGIDLGGIAKGFIADKLKDYLIGKGVKSAVINLGGDVAEIGAKPDGTPYRVGIQYPYNETGKTIAIVQCSDKSVVTSGCYERYFEIDGTQYHHILDPATGYPAENNLLSATIISDLSVDGDCLSTACYVLGYEKAVKLIESLDNVEAIFVDKNYDVFMTSGLTSSNNVITFK